MISNLSVPLVSLVDVGLMGHMTDSSYIIAIGLGVTIFNFLFWSFGFLRMSTTGLIAKSYGQNDQYHLTKWTIKSLLIAISLGLLIVLLQDFIIQMSIFLIDSNAFISEKIKVYLEIRIWSAPATLVSYVYLGWFIGFQRSNLVLLFNVILNVSNILLSYILVFHLNMNIEGVAIGSLFAPYLAVLVTTPFIFRQIDHKKIITILKEKKDWTVLFQLNLNIFIRTVCLIFVLSFLKVKLSSGNNLIGAANLLLLEFVTIAAYFIDAIAYAAEATSGKYLGKKDLQLFLSAKRISFQLGFICATLLSFIYLIFGDFILGLLTDKMELITLAQPYSKYLIIFPLIAIWAFIWDGIFIGVSASTSMRNSMLLSSIIFLAVYYLLDRQFGNDGKWIALLLFMLSRGLIQYVQFEFRIIKHLKLEVFNAN